MTTQEFLAEVERRGFAVGEPPALRKQTTTEIEARAEELQKEVARRRSLKLAAAASSSAAAEPSPPSRTGLTGEMATLDNEPQGKKRKTEAAASSSRDDTEN